MEEATPESNKIPTDDKGLTENEKIEVIIDEEDLEQDWKPTVIVLGPGGMKGLLEIGAMRYLEQIGMLSEIEIYIGCSVGSIISLLSICGYKAQDLMVEADQTSMFSNMESSIKTMCENMGVVSAELMGQRLSKLISLKMGIVPTLEQLYLMTGKILVCSTFNVTQKKRVYLSKDNYPNLNCVKACLMSSAVPFLISRVEHEGCYYADGAMGDPYPIHLLDNGKRKILGIYINTEEVKSSSDYIEYAVNIFESITRIPDKIKDRVAQSTSACRHIELKCGIRDTTGVSLETKDKAKLITDGWKAAKMVFPSVITIHGLETKKYPNTNIYKNNVSTKVEDGNILIKIDEDTKKTMDRFGINLIKKTTDKRPMDKRPIEEENHINKTINNKVKQEKENKKDKDSKNVEQEQHKQ